MCACVCKRYLDSEVITTKQQMTLYTGCECNEMTLILHKVVDLKVYGTAHHSEAIQNI